MKTDSSLYIPIYEFQCDESIVNNVLTILPSLNYSKDRSDTELSDSFYHDQLFQWFKDCLDLVKKDLYNDDLSLNISTCWVNRIKRLQKIGLHQHMNSIVSGVLYFSDETTGKTIFKYPNPWYHAENYKVLKLSKDSKFYSSLNPAFISSEILPRKGKLILFPSVVFHETTAHNASSDRYTLAFNTFVTGNLESNVTGRLNIKLGV